MQDLENFMNAELDNVSTSIEQVEPAQDPPGTEKFARVIDQGEQSDNANYAAKVKQGLDVDMTRAAEVEKIAAKMKVPSAYVDRNLDTIKRRKKQRDLQQLKIEGSSMPEWMKDANRAAMLHQDLDNAKLVEAISSPLKEDPSLVGEAVDRSYRRLKSGLLMARMIHGLGDQEDLAKRFSELELESRDAQARTPEYVTKFHKDAEKDLTEASSAWQSFVKTWRDEEDKDLIARVSELAGKSGDVISESFDVAVEGAKNPKAIAFQALESSIQSFTPTVLGLGGALVGGKAGYAAVAYPTGVLMEYMGTLEEVARERGVDLADPQAMTALMQDKEFVADAQAQALRKGLTVSAIERATELLGAKIVSGAFKGGSVAAKAGKVLGGVATESAGEGLGEFGGKVAQKKDLAAGDPGEAIMESLSALAMMGGGGAISMSTQATAKARNYVTKNLPKAIRQVKGMKVETDMAVAYQQKLESLGEVAANSEIKNMDSAAFADLMKTTSKDEQVYFQAEDWKNHWEKRGENPVAKADELLPGGRKSYAEATTNGGSVEVPLGEFISNFSDLENFKDLTRLARQSPNTINANQGGNISANISQVVKDLVQESVVEAEKIQTEQDIIRSFKQGIVEQEIDAGNSQADAKAKAELVSRVFQNQARESGISIAEFAEQAGLDIQGFKTLSEADKYIAAQRILGQKEENIKAAAEAKELTLEELPEETRVEAESMIADQLQTMAVELENSVKGSRVFTEAEKGGAPDVQGVKSTFPEWYAEAKIKSKDIRKILERGKGAPYERLKAIAVSRLREGYRSDKAGILEEPSNEYRNLVGLPSIVDGKLQGIDIEDVPFQKDNKDRFFQSEKGIEIANRDSLGFYSGLEQILLGPKFNFKAMPAKNLLAQLKKAGVKPEEMEFTGLQELLETTEGKVFKEDILKLVRAGGLQLNEIVRDGKKTPKISKKIYPTFTDVNREEVTLEIQEWEDGEPQETQWKDFTNREEAEQYLEDTYGEGLPTKFGEWALPDGENYREVLLQLPPNREGLQITREGSQWVALENGVEIGRDSNRRALRYRLDIDQEATANDNYRSSHWDEENVLAHMRLADHTTKDGKKTLLIEEIQSDWHQAGRKKGYKREGEIKELPKGYKVELNTIDNPISFPGSKPAIGMWVVTTNEGKFAMAAKSKELAIEKAVTNLNRPSRAAVPDAPLKKTEAWATLAFKRILSMAVAQGYDSVSLTPGQVQSDRYNLSKDVEEINWIKSAIKEGNYTVSTLLKESPDMPKVLDMSEEQIVANLGEDVAKKIIGTDKGKLSNSDLDVPSPGMIKFYNEMLPSAIQKYVKKLDKKAKIMNSEVVYKDPKKFKDEYTGEELSPQEIEEIRDSLSPQHQDKLEAVEIEMVNGYTFKEAMARVNSSGLAKALGGKIVTKTGAENLQQVKTLDITDKIKAKVSEGQTLFQQDDKKVRGFTEISIPDKILLGYLKDANKSTGLHELGHVFLETIKLTDQNIQAMEELGKDQEDFLARKEVLLKELEVESLDDIQTEHHEKFARLFEAYLLEGKAPSPALETVFKRFRTWLVSVYRDIRGLISSAEFDIKLSKDMREIFDRLLIIEDEILEAEESTGYSREEIGSFFDSLNLNPEDNAKLLEAYEEAHDEAIVTLQKENATQYRKRRDKEYKARKKELKEAFTQEAQKLPVYIAQTEMKAQKVKLRTSDLEAVLPPDRVKAFPKNLHKKDGIPADQVGDAVAYDSGRELIEDIDKNPSEKQFIDSMTELKLGEEYGDFLSPSEEQELNVAALDAVNNTKKEKVQKLELDALFKKSPAEVKKLIRKTTTKLPTTAEAKALAKARIKRTSIRNAKAHTYRRLEVKNRREAGLFLTQGKFKESIDAKLKESFNYQLGREASEVEKFVEKSIAKNKKRFGKSDKDLAKRGNVDMLRSAEAILNKFGLVSDSRADKLEVYLSNLKKYDPEAYEKVDVFTNEILVMDSVNYRDLSVADFEDIMEVVDTIYTLGEEEAKITLDDGTVVQKETVINELFEDLNNTEAKGFKADQEKYKGFASLSNSIIAQMTRLEHLFGSLGPKFTKYFWDLANHGQNQYDADLIARRESLNTILGDHFKGVFEDKTTIDLNKYFVGLEPGQSTLSKHQLVMALIHSGNDSNKKKLLLGRGWGEVDFEGNLYTTRYDLMLSVLMDNGTIDKNMMDGVQKIWDLFEDIKPGVQKAYKKVFGHFFREIEANEFVTPFGTYRGGYAPAVTDPSLVAEASDRERAASTEIENMQNTFAQTTKGFTKERESAYNKALLLDFRIIPTHIEQTVRFTNIEPVLSDMNKILKSRALTDQMFKMNPKWVKETIKPWLARYATQRTTPPSDSEAGTFLTRTLSKLRTNANQQLMMGNLVNTFENLSDFTTLFLEVKPRYMTQAFKTFTQGRKEMASSISEQSPFMKLRLEHQIFDIQDQYNKIVNVTPGAKGAIKNIQEMASRNTYILQAAVSNNMEIVAWQAAYEQAIVQGKSTKQAVKNADSIIRRVMSGGRVLDYSKIESGNVLQKLILTFYGFFNNKANLIWHSKRETKGKAVALGIFAPAIIGSLLRSAVRGKFGDDDEEYMDDVAGLLLLEPVKFTAAMFPGGGSAFRLVEGQFTDAPYDDRLSISPLVGMVEAGRGVTRLLTKDEISGRDIRDTMNFFGTMTGIPLGPLGKPIGFMIDLEQGKQSANTPLDYARGLTVGRSGKR